MHVFVRRNLPESPKKRAQQLWDQTYRINHVDDTTQAQIWSTRALGIELANQKRLDSDIRANTLFDNIDLCCVAD